jgi:hypothetical protein
MMSSNDIHVLSEINPVSSNAQEWDKSTIQ